MPPSDPLRGPASLECQRCPLHLLPHPLPGHLTAHGHHLPHHLTGHVTDHLTDHLTGHVTDHLTDHLIDHVTDHLTDYVTDHMTDHQAYHPIDHSGVDLVPDRLPGTEISHTMHCTLHTPRTKHSERFPERSLGRQRALDTLNTTGGCGQWVWSGREARMRSSRGGGEGAAHSELGIMSPASWGRGSPSSTPAQPHMELEMEVRL